MGCAGTQCQRRRVSGPGQNPVNTTRHGDRYAGWAPRARPGHTRPGGPAALRLRQRVVLLGRRRQLRQPSAFEGSAQTYSAREGHHHDQVFLAHGRRNTQGYRPLSPRSGHRLLRYCVAALRHQGGLAGRMQRRHGSGQRVSREGRDPHAWRFLSFAGGAEDGGEDRLGACGSGAHQSGRSQDGCRSQDRARCAARNEGRRQGNHRDEDSRRRHVEASHRRNAAICHGAERAGLHHHWR